MLTLVVMQFWINIFVVIRMLIVLCVRLFYLFSLKCKNRKMHSSCWGWLKEKELWLSMTSSVYFSILKPNLSHVSIHWQLCQKFMRRKKWTKSIVKNPLNVSIKTPSASNIIIMLLSMSYYWIVCHELLLWFCVFQKSIYFIQ